MNVKYKYTEIELRDIVEKSKSMGHLLKLCGVIPAGGNYSTMKQRLKIWNIDTTHWGKTMRERQGWLKGKTHNWAPKMPLEQILVENTPYRGSTYALKNRLIKDGLFERKCYDCKRTEWKNQPIPIELEHVNGNRFDCRIENLTLFCPNCHALTPTYRGKNKGRYSSTIVS
jgi:hypothetical protein